VGFETRVERARQEAWRAEAHAEALNDMIDEAVELRHSPVLRKGLERESAILDGAATQDHPRGVDSEGAPRSSLPHQNALNFGPFPDNSDHLRVRTNLNAGNGCHELPRHWVSPGIERRVCRP